MLTLNGEVLQYDQEFQVDGVIYPANWLRRSTSQEKQNIGISESPPPTWYDRRFYTAVGVPKDLVALKVKWVHDNKMDTRERLYDTDWEVIKSVDPSSASTVVPAGTIAVRTHIRSQSESREQQILAADTVEELAEYINSAAFNNWTVLPS